MIIVNITIVTLVIKHVLAKSYNYSRKLEIFFYSKLTWVVVSRGCFLRKGWGKWQSLRANYWARQPAGSGTRAKIFWVLHLEISAHHHPRALYWVSCLRQLVGTIAKPNHREENAEGWRERGRKEKQNWKKKSVQNKLAKQDSRTQKIQC